MFKKCGYQSSYDKYKTIFESLTYKHSALSVEMKWVECYPILSVRLEIYLIFTILGYQNIKLHSLHIK